MATQPGKVQNFSKVHLILGGFRVDAFDVAGITVAWQGVSASVQIGPDGIPVFNHTDTANALLTATVTVASGAIDYFDAWLRRGTSKIVSLMDLNGRTFLTDANGMPEKRPDLTINGELNPYALSILVPNFRGPIGGLNPNFSGPVGG